MVAMPMKALNFSCAVVVRMGDGLHAWVTRGLKIKNNFASCHNRRLARFFLNRPHGTVGEQSPGTRPRDFMEPLISGINGALPWR